MLPLKHRFSAEGHFAFQGTFSDMGGHFCLSQFAEALAAVILWV